MKTDNELIAEFMGMKIGSGFGALTVIYKGQYCTPHFDTSWDWLMPVVEKIHTSRNYKPHFSLKPRGVNIEIRPNFCNINLPDTSQGFDYKNDCYNADPLFTMTNGKLEGGTIECVYNSVVEYIKWYNESLTSEEKESIYQKSK